MHDFVLGTDYNVRDDHTDDFIDGPNIGGFDPQAPRYGTLPATGPLNSNASNSHQRTRGVSGYVKDTIRLGERWIVSPGLRYQHFWTLSGARDPFVTYTDANSGTVLPFLGILYRASPIVSVYANYGRSYQPNLLTDFGSVIEGGYAPERGRQYEAGAKLDTGTWSAQIAAFDIVKTNVLQNVGFDAGGNTLQRPAGRVGSRGIEVSLTGRILHNLEALASYAYTDARIIEDSATTVGHQPANVAPHVGSAFITYVAPASGALSGIRLGGGARYVDRRFGDVANSFVMPSYVVADAFIAWALPGAARGATLRLNATNLTDRDYFSASAGSAVRVAYGEARTVRLSLNTVF